MLIDPDSLPEFTRAVSDAFVNAALGELDPADRAAAREALQSAGILPPPTVDDDPLGRRRSNAGGPRTRSNIAA